MSEAESDAGRAQIDLSARYAKGENPEPLIRALASGLIGAGLVLAVDRLIPTSQLAVFDPRSGAAQALPQGWLWPALGADFLLGDPMQTAIGITLLVVILVLASFVYAYGQFRRFAGGGGPRSGLIWSLLLWLLVLPSLSARSVAWLSDGPASGSDAAAALLASTGLLIESAISLAAYGLLVGWLCPAPEDFLDRGDP